MTLGEIVRFLAEEQKLYIPPQELAVVILDDMPDAIAGMVEVLQSWPNIVCETVIHSSKSMPYIPWLTDVLLLDYDFDQNERRTTITGGEIAEVLWKHGFPGLVVATTIRELGSFERHAEWHYEDKLALSPRWPFLDTVKKFTDFMEPIFKLAVTKKSMGARSVGA